MSEEHEHEVDTHAVKEQARTAAERGESIREDVRNITMKALSKGRFDVKKIKQIIGAVMEGASSGAQSRDSNVKDTLAETMAGLDEALSNSAEASKLAIEEAASHLSDFGKQDLKRALDDLRTLEDMFLDTAKDVAKRSDEVVRNSLNDLVKHARNSGTAAGNKSTEIVNSLNQELGQTLRETVSTGADAALTVGSHMSQAAAGFLQGLAKTLDDKVTGSTAGNATDKKE